MIADEMALWHGQPEDDCGAPDSGYRKRVGDTVEFGGLLGYAPIISGQPFLLRQLCQTYRTYPGTSTQL